METTSLTSQEFRTTTWNPVTGCDRVSAGCDHCYALTLARRLKSFGLEKYQNDGDARTSGPGFAVTTHPKTLAQPYGWKQPKVIFVTSMGDLFHPEVPLGFIQDVFRVMGETPRHTYQLLTKRPGRARKIADELEWPANLWLGTSVEDERVLFRLDQLQETPAALKFLSCEPLLGPLDDLDLSGIGWVIVSGEAGRDCRPMRLEWATSIRDQAIGAGVPFFFKQWGGRSGRISGRELEGQIWNQTPLHPTLEPILATNLNGEIL